MTGPLIGNKAGPVPLADDKREAFGRFRGPPVGPESPPGRHHLAPSDGIPEGLGTIDHSTKGVGTTDHSAGRHSTGALGTINHSAGGLGAIHHSTPSGGFGASHERRLVDSAPNFGPEITEWLIVPISIHRDLRKHTDPVGTINHSALQDPKTRSQSTTRTGNQGHNRPLAAEWLIGPSPTVEWSIRPSLDAEWSIRSLASSTGLGPVPGLAGNRGPESGI
jgi:hypothetical protein